MSKPAPIDLEGLPEADLRHVQVLTDGTGILQHASYGAPNHDHGYCSDDNARALIAGALHSRLYGYDEQIMPIQEYLGFLNYAFNDRTGRFRNFMSYDRQWLEDIGSEDSHGRTIWALGVTVAMAPNEAVSGLAQDLLVRALPPIGAFPYIRSKAFSLIGLDAYLSVEPDDVQAGQVRADLAEQLYAAYVQNAHPDWPWWEDVVTYANAKLPHALLLCGQALGRQDWVEAALLALRWLIGVQMAEDGHLTIIGNRGWLVRGGGRARLAQQPLEAHAIVLAALTATRITGDRAWVDVALRALEWFLGRNDRGLPLYNADTGGCHDGLEDDQVNANQGAESTLAYLSSVLELHAYRRRSQSDQST